MIGLIDVFEVCWVDGVMGLVLDGVFVVFVFL